MTKLLIQLSPTITVEVEGNEECECIRQAAFWTGLPTECPECGCPLTLFYRTPKDYEYYGLRCTGPVTHESTFGKHKADGSLFFREREPFQLARAPKTDEDGWPVDEEPASAPPPARAGNGRAATALKPVQQAPAAPPASGPVCADCGKPLTLGQASFSENKFGRMLCPTHQS